jgi:hypothetical protein
MQADSCSRPLLGDGRSADPVGRGEADRHRESAVGLWSGGDGGAVGGGDRADD